MMDVRTGGEVVGVVIYVAYSGTYTLSKPGPPSGVIKNKVVLFVSALVGPEGFTRFSGIYKAPASSQIGAMGMLGK